MEPLISIIVPIYNVEKYLHRCIDSIISQTLDNIEIILVNDGSPDSCQSICEEYIKKDDRIKLINKKNEGLGMARNTGIEIARGEFIAFVDSDDYIDTDMYEKMYNAAKAQNADTCICNYKRRDTSNNIVRRKYKMNSKIYEGTHVIDDLLSSMIGTSPTSKDDVEIGMSVWKCIFSKNIIKYNDIKFCSERQFISEDIIFDIDYFVHSKKVVTIEDELYNYCDNGASLTKTYKKDRFEREVILYLEIKRKLEQVNIFNKYKLNLYRTFIGRSRTCIKAEANNLNYNESIKNIKLILRNHELQEILKSYPIKDLPLKQKIFTYLTKYKFAKILYRISK